MTGIVPLPRAHSKTALLHSLLLPQPDHLFSWATLAQAPLGSSQVPAFPLLSPQMALWDPKGTGLGRGGVASCLPQSPPKLSVPPPSVRNQGRAVAILQMSKTGKGNHLFVFKRPRPSQEFRVVPPLLLGCSMGKGLRFVLELHLAQNSSEEPGE